MRRLVPALLLIGCARAIGWSADDVEALKSRVAELEQEVIELKARSVPFSALAVDSVNVSCWHLLDDAGALTPEVRKLLSLSEPEAKAVDEAVAQARARVAEAVAALKPHGDVVGGRFKLVVGPFREAGKQAQDALKKSLNETLGRERAAFFDKLARSQLDNSLLQFGQADYTFTVEKSPMGYSYQIEHKSDHGSGSSSSSGLKLGPDFAVVKAYVPPAFGGSAGAEAAPAPAPAAPAPAKPRAEF